MTALAGPFLAVVALWWASTGAILWLVRRPAKTFGWTLAGLGGLAGLAAAGISATAGSTTPGAAYCGFACALTIWAWHEAAFLMGAVTGPRRTVCPPGLSGWARFRAASATVIHHEVALLLTLLGVAALSWGAPNQTATLTFALLFGLRISSKMNIFFGVANLPMTFLPARLGYLASYFRRRRFNAFFPASLAVAAAVAFVCAASALAPAAAPGAVAASGLLFALAALGVLEHLFLMTPSPDRALWGWALRSAPPRATPPNNPALVLAGREP